mmetsp:Transcript_73625/g.137589  ORF Transcript_73625/g.137589 Transcript_73625/m.137589 type:complete len:760 (-) Transcript_73625:126-2405(-)
MASFCRSLLTFPRACDGAARKSGVRSLQLAYGKKEPLVVGYRCFAAPAAASQQGVEHLRNFGISAHIDSGKTTLTERILFYTGKIQEIHEVRGKDGVGAKMDHMELEREKGITITSAATYCSWKAADKDFHLNLIDTPGHVDFTIEVERALRILDGAVMICCGVGGVQSQTITVDRQMKRYGVPRIVFINKLDRYGADPFLVLDQIRKKLGLVVQPIQLPIGEEDNFNGVVDVISRKAHYFEGDHGLTRRIDEVPENLKERMEELHANLLETLAELDDTFAEVYLESDVVTEADIHSAIRRTTLDLKFCPMLMGSAYKNRGVQNLLDAICAYLPSPLDKQNKALNADDESEEVELSTKETAPFVGFAFKIQDHPQVGQVTYLRVYQGKLSKGDQVLNMLTQKKVSVKRLVRMHSNEIKDVASAGVGDIIAIAGMEVESGVTFTDGKQRVVCSSMYVPDPVMSLAVSAGRDDQPKFQKALRRFQREDPTFKVNVEEESKETIISGMGELHLEIYCERMRREYGVDLKTGEPKVNYRETITEKAPYDYLHKRQSGGRGQYGKIIGYIEPVPEDQQTQENPETIVFKASLDGNTIDPKYVPSVHKGFQHCANKGFLTGHPVINLRCVLEDGAQHEVDSSDLAFHCAAEGAFNQAFQEAVPVVLEPIMKLEVTYPSEFQPATLQTINNREGSISTTKALSTDNSVAEATVPLRRMFGYSSELRSVTQGQGEFSMEFDHYEQMPSNKQEELIAEHKKKLREARL